MSKDLKRYDRETIAERRVLIEAIEWAERAEAEGAVSTAQLRVAAIQLLSARRAVDEDGDAEGEAI